MFISYLYYIKKVVDNYFNNFKQENTLNTFSKLNYLTKQTGQILNWS